MTDKKKKKDADPTPTGDYEVGYQKPPKHTRFKPGQSGNPQGRPKGTKNLKTDLMEELGEMIVIREGGRSRKVTKQRAFVKSVFARTLKGDARAASLLNSMMTHLLDTGEGAPAIEELLLEDEIEILQEYLGRALRDDERRTETEPDNDEDPENAS